MGDVRQRTVRHRRDGDLRFHVVSAPANVQLLVDLGEGDNRCYVTGAGLGAGGSLNLNAGSGDDLFVVSAVPLASGLAIHGGSQAAGDELVYTSGPASGAFPGNGTLDPADPNADSIYYNSIEAFSVGDWLFSNGFE